MSAGWYWQPVRGRSLGVNLPSAFGEALREAFGGREELDAGDLGTLRGLRAGLKDDREAIDKLISAIEEHGAVRVWAEY